MDDRIQRLIRIAAERFRGGAFERERMGSEPGA